LYRKAFGFLTRRLVHSLGQPPLAYRRNQAQMNEDFARLEQPQRRLAARF
jgi:hypothetical protein